MRGDSPTRTNTAVSNNTGLETSHLSGIRRTRSASPQSPLSLQHNSLNDLDYVAYRRIQAGALHDLLLETFISVFESRSALWFGDSCCPYLELNVVCLMSTPIPPDNAYPSYSDGSYLSSGQLSSAETSIHSLFA